MSIILNEMEATVVSQPAVSRTPQEKGIKLFFILVTLALVITSLTGAALTWDGSYFLYKIVDQRQPFVDHSRWTSALLQFPTLVVSLVSRNLWLLQTVFGLSYALVPLTALAVSWWLVRDRAPSMFKWAVFGIGLGTLPTQIFFVGDATMALQLSWPLFLAALTGIRGRKTIVVILLSAFVLVVHPDAIILFGIAAVLSLLTGWREYTRRSNNAPERVIGNGAGNGAEVGNKIKAKLTGSLVYWVWGGIFAALSLVALVKLFFLHTTYESEQISLAVLQIQYDNAVTGLPIFFTIMVWVIAAWNFAATLAIRNNNRKLADILIPFQLGLMIIAGITLIYWGANTHLWEKAIDFRTWALILALPLVILAGLDRWLNIPHIQSHFATGGVTPSSKTEYSGMNSDQTGQPNLLEIPELKTPKVVKLVRGSEEEAPLEGNGAVDWKFNRLFLGFTGAIFLAVLTFQSLAWTGLTSDFKSALQLDPYTCVSTSSENISKLVQNTPLDHWSLTPYSLLLGGSQPARVVLPGAGCAKAGTDQQQGFQVTDWEWRNWSGGQLNLLPLRQSIQSNEKTPPPVCRFYMGDGWYSADNENGRWLRWNNGKGSIDIFLPQDGTVVLNGFSKTIAQPNTLEIRLNGATQKKISLNSLDVTPFDPVTLQLKSGHNIIEIVGANPPGHYPKDTRDLGIAVSALTITDSKTGNQCGLQN